MMTLQQIARVRWFMLAVVLGLALAQFFIFRPLSRKAEALDEQLAKVGQELLNVNLDISGIHNLDLKEVQKTRETLLASLAAAETNGQLIAHRIEFEPEIRAKLKEPFLLIDFQNERGKRIEQLTDLARTQQVTLEATALAGFPEHKAEMKEPNLLWAELAMVHHVLTAAINSKAGTVKNLSLLTVQPYRPAGGTEVYLEEIPLRVELVASVESVANFLLALPLRGDEIKAAGLPESRPGKPALFLDKLIIRKVSPEKLAEVHLDAVVCGFVSAQDLQPARVEDKVR